MGPSELARNLGISLTKTIHFLKEIEQLGVSSREEETNALISRRMVRDEYISQQRRDAGSKGGNPILLKQNPSKAQANVEQKPTPSSSSSSSSSKENTYGEYSPEFEAFWKAYPKRKSKGDAWKAWKRINPDATTRDLIFAGIRRAEASADWRKSNGQFVPYPASWLNSRGWQDDIASATQRVLVPVC